MPTHNLYQGRQTWLNTFAEYEGKPVAAREIATRALIMHEGRVLMVYEDHMNAWWLPGGRIKPKESLFEGVVREVEEETGLSVEIGDLAFMFDVIFPLWDTATNKHMFHFVFNATVNQPIDFIEREHFDTDPDHPGKVSKMRWFTQDELKAEPRIFPACMRDLDLNSIKPKSVRYWGNRVQDGAPADFALDRFYVSARAVTLQDDKLLLVRNKKSDWWYGAGGGIELAEDVFAAAQREVQEETGLVVQATHVVAVDEFYSHTARIHQINIYTACQPVGPQEITPEWVDPAGYVGEARFFSADEFRQHPRAFPPHLFNIAWPHLTESEGETK